MRFAFLVPILALFSGAASAAGGPAGYPATLMDAPATLTEPPAPFVRLGKPVVMLEKTTLEDVVLHTGGMRLSPRDLVPCGHRRRTPHASLAHRNRRSARFRSAARMDGRGRKTRLRLPAAFARTSSRAARQSGARHEEGRRSRAPRPRGWHYWFSQRFLRNERHFQMLELNWLGVRFEDGRAVRLFSSQVTNP